MMKLIVLLNNHIPEQEFHVATSEGNVAAKHKFNIE